MQRWLGCDGKNKNSSLHDGSRHDCIPDIQAHRHSHSLQQSPAANCTMQTVLICTVQHILSGGSNEGGIGGACSTYREQNAQMVWWGYLKQSIGRTSNEWEDIKMDLKAIGCEGMDHNYPRHKSVWGSKVTAPLILNLNTVISFHLDCFTLRYRVAGTHCIESWPSFRAGPGCVL